MNKTVTSALPDVQSGPPPIEGVPLSEVGVHGIRWPISLATRGDGYQSTVASLRVSVSLQPDVKGAHLSRFMEQLHEQSQQGLTLDRFAEVMEGIREAQNNALAATGVVRFPYFLMREAPVTGASALMDYECEYRVSIDKDVVVKSLRVEVPVTSLCPCSKAVSDYGAHNQRGTVVIDIDVRDDDWVWLEELIEIAESSGSCPVYPILKRPDERYVTMLAYDDPVFVEDMVRRAAQYASKVLGDRVSRIYISADNDESIHNHNAYAVTEWRA